MPEYTVQTHGADQTEALAASLAPGLHAGDRILLFGDLGGGKTTFVRGLLRGLGHPDVRDVCSPTFALHHRYVGGRLPVDHLDLYRLEGGPALALQGVLDPLEDASALVVVEWPQRLHERPAGIVLEVYLQRDEASEDTRRVRLVLADAATSRLAPALTRQPRAEDSLP